MFLYNSLKKATLLLTLILSGFAAEDYTEANLGVSLDYSRFSTEGGVYLDIYLMIPQSFFTYVEGKSGLEARVVFQTALIQDDLVPYPPDSWERIYRAKNQTSIAGLGYVPDISKFYVEAGEYILQVDILDVHSNRRQRIRKLVSLELFPKDEVSMSDITIASQIVKADKDNEFTKHGYDVVPNAERTFAPTASMLYYYFETYGLSSSGNYLIHNQILSLNEEVVQEFPARSKKTPGSSAVEWGGINTAGLKSGIYKLLITLTDEASQKSVSRKKTFYVLRPKLAEQAKTVAEDEYTSLNEAQLDDLFKVVKIIMGKREQQLFKQSDLGGKQRILTAFWSRNDPDPETEINEYKEEFYSLVQFANREFGSERDEGWKTDQGRVLIQYGRPNNIERNPYSLEQKPWEVWEYYEVEGGAQFFFVDRTGFGSFQLVHSTARSEVQDYNWERYLN